jgi:hypothetical protein
MQLLCAIFWRPLWLLWLHCIFPHYLINVTIFGERKVIERKMCFDFLYICLNISHSKKNLARYCHKCKKSSGKVPVNFVGFWWIFNFLDRFSKKTLNIKFHENPSSGSRVIPCGRTDGHDEANSRLSHFLNAPKNATLFPRCWSI